MVASNQANALLLGSVAIHNKCVHIALHERLALTVK